MVFLWTTSRFIHEAFQVIEGWGLRYMCMMVWDKVWGPKPCTYPMYNAEFILVAKRGAPCFLDTKGFRLVNQWRAVIDSSIKNMNQRVGSAKPEGFYDLLRRVTPEPRIDLFARRRIDGFDAWATRFPMPADAELTRLLAKKAAVQAAIDQIVGDNTTGGSFGDVSVRRVELRELNAQLDLANLHIQQRKSELLNLPSPVWGSVVRPTTQKPDAYTD